MFKASNVFFDCPLFLQSTVYNTFLSLFLCAYIYIHPSFYPPQGCSDILGIFPF